MTQDTHLLELLYELRTSIERMDSLKPQLDHAIANIECGGGAADIESPAGDVFHKQDTEDAVKGSLLAKDPQGSGDGMAGASSYPALYLSSGDGMAGASSYPALTSSERLLLKLGRCPDCGSGGIHWQAGPQGGASRNWRCGKCGSCFNLTDGPFRSRALFAERISQPGSVSGAAGPAVQSQPSHEEPAKGSQAEKR